MRKFGRILGWRHGKDGGGKNSPNGAPNAARLHEAPCFHQLSSTRLLHGGKPVQRAPPPPASLIVADEASELWCARCAGTDFAHLLDWKPGDPRPWVQLSHVLEQEGEPECPYCSFFRALLGVASSSTEQQQEDAGASAGAGKFAPYLRIRLAFERLGVKEKHELGKAVLIEVMAKNKSLPWGYVVKAADEEGASMAGYMGDAETLGLRGRIVTPLLDPLLPRLWLDYCVDHHGDTEGCAREEPPVSGLRLVDVESGCVVSAEDLDQATYPDYLSLSYVWGVGEWGDELEEGGKLPADVPPLIADAIGFTKTLGFRYIWIDRYCFFQLPEATRRLQLDRMGDIFSQSTLTLIVAAGDGVSEGIPGISVPRNTQLSLKTDTGLFTTSLLRPDAEVASSTWASRAWTYQEGLLARRRLIFTPSQVYFQCRSLHCHESLSVPLEKAPALNLGRVFPEHGGGSQASDLKTHIKAYINKEQAQAEDRLNAFRGLLYHYRHKLDHGVDSLLGLPLFHPEAFSTDKVVSQTDRLAVALSWVPNHTLASQSTPMMPYLLDPARHFPSWTWLAWRLRPGQTPLNHSFHFSLLGDSEGSPVSAPPQMEISVGFEDGKLLSWEIDGDAIGKRREETISFLRIRSYVFEMTVDKEGENVALAGVNLDRARRDAVKGWFRAAAATAQLPALNEDADSSDSQIGLPDGEYQLTGVILSGKNWRNDGQPVEATFLICKRQGWRTPKKEVKEVQKEEEEAPTGKQSGDTTGSEDKEDESQEEKMEEVKDKKKAKVAEEEEADKMVRLGALTITFNSFTPFDENKAVLEGLELDAGDRGDMNVELRDIDIY